MQEYSNEEIDALGLQIGCLVRVERLRKKISQETLGLMIGSNNTTIGRIERFENDTNWKHLFKICQALNLDFLSLFNLKSLTELLSIVKECIELEDRLTTQKERYYKDLEIKIKKVFEDISS
ncbi:helix-turn-helix transcriptional regulator [uncultured Chryseobacterium sp.]|uniref:helix-turn-helix transcriptional regulator n=1 Tax=uncultured Chryseobacterium sp. TaxID=259322 RepID=UPI0025DA0619|nr:helix-turn-helix transcriptional regulator [uncultured Chryseobacterium sp.]